VSCCRNFGTGILIPVTNAIERLNGEIKRRTEVVGVSVLAMPPAWLRAFHSPTKPPSPA